MNDLTTTQNSSAGRPTSPPMSEALTWLLDSAGSPDAAVASIAGDPELAQEARRVLPALRAVATTTAGAEGVRSVIGQRLATFPQPQRTQEEAAAWWADYIDVLEDVSLAALEAGMRAYVRLPDSEFMPKPGKLRELAFSAPCRSLTRVHRATLAIRKAEEPVGMIAPPKADPQAVKKLLADFQAGSAAKTTKAELPYIGGVADETGITPQMREILARQRGGEA